MAAVGRRPHGGWTQQDGEEAAAERALLRRGAQEPPAAPRAPWKERLSRGGSSTGGRVFLTVGASFLNSRVTPLSEGGTLALPSAEQPS